MNFVLLCDGSSFDISWGNWKEGFILFMSVSFCSKLQSHHNSSGCQFFTILTQIKLCLFVWQKLYANQLYNWNDFIEIWLMLIKTCTMQLILTLPRGNYGKYPSSACRYWHKWNNIGSLGEQNINTIQIETKKSLYIHHQAGNNPMIGNLIVNLDITSKMGKSWNKPSN